MIFRDKTYIQLANGWLFNVTGYQHPPGYVYASLKYIDGEKWTGGYERAKAFLQDSHPEFVDEYIRVPEDQIKRVFEPQIRWAELQQTETDSPILAEAVELGQRLRSLLQIPDSKNELVDTEFGITDSLLWGEGHADSDIDLVVIGRDNANRLMQFAETIYQHDFFERPDPLRMTAPYSLSVENWPQILSRKLHMGSYKGRLFSVRVVLRESECSSLLPSQPTNERVSEIEFRVDNVEDSLIFPSTYRNAVGDELVDYSVVYEGIFRVGDMVRCDCHRETMDGSSLNRFVIAGNVRF